MDSLLKQIRLQLGIISIATEENLFKTVIKENEVFHSSLTKDK